MQRRIKEAIEFTLSNIWGCIDWQKTDKRRLINIWDEFTNKVKSAAYTTNSYKNFVSKLCKKMGIITLKFRDILEIENNFTDEEKEKILKELRDNTQLYILELKLSREIIREQRRLKEEEEEKEKEKEKEKVSKRKVKIDTKKGAILC